MKNVNTSAKKSCLRKLGMEKFAAKVGSSTRDLGHPRYAGFSQNGKKEFAEKSANIKRFVQSRGK